MASLFTLVAILQYMNRSNIARNTSIGNSKHPPYVNDGVKGPQKLRSSDDIESILVTSWKIEITTKLNRFACEYVFKQQPRSVC